MSMKVLSRLRHFLRSRRPRPRQRSFLSTVARSRQLGLNGACLPVLLLRGLLRALLRMLFLVGCKRQSTLSRRLRRRRGRSCWTRTQSCRACCAESRRRTGTTCIRPRAQSSAHERLGHGILSTAIVKSWAVRRSGKRGERRNQIKQQPLLFSTQLEYSTKET